MPSLFARLRPAPLPSCAAYDAAVNTARRRDWYLAGAVPDTMDGRFAVLTTVLALLTLRFENGGLAGSPPSVALTEAFIADMHAQMQQAGFGDPSLGKQVRWLVGSLASRVDAWRATLGGSAVWKETVRRSVYRDEDVAEDSLDWSMKACRDLSERLAAASFESVVGGVW